MIVCGWCGQPASESCANCGRDPVLPWFQRGLPAPVIDEAAGRPVLDASAIRHRLAQARDAVGAAATVEQLAEWLAVSPRTVRRWRKRIDGH